MKLKLIALFLLIGASQVLHAQTTDQVPVGDTVYLYNPANEKFFVGENQYKTQASLSANHAYKVVVNKYLDQNNQWDGKTYVMTDSVEAGNYGFSYRNIFIDAIDCVIWVDQSERSEFSDYLWEIVPSKTMKGAFNIYPAEANNAYKHSNMPDRWLGCCDTTALEYPLVSLVKTTDPKASIDWTFVPMAQGDKMLAERHKALAQKRLALLTGGKPVTSELSITPLLVNPQFSDSKASGWHTTFDVKRGTVTWCGGDQSNPCAEAWQCNFDFCQKLEGMPTGLYKVDMQAFARTNEPRFAWYERDSAFISTVIYANEAELPVHNLMRNTFPSRNDYDFLRPAIDGTNKAAWETVEGSYVLNNLRATSLAFAKGLFDQSIYCYVGDGTLQVGIKEPVVRNGAWSAWDNLRITYLPETKENYAKAIRYHVEKAKETEKIAKTMKGVDVKSLTKALTGVETLLKQGSFSQLRDRLALINKAMKRTREAMLASLHFASPMQVTSMNPTVDKRRQELNRIHTLGLSYLTLGAMAEKDQNMELSLKCLQSGSDLFAAYPDAFCRQLVAVARAIYHQQLAAGHGDEAANTMVTLVERLEPYNTNAVLKELDNIYPKAGELLSVQKNYSKAEEIYIKAANLSLRLGNIEELANRFNMLAYCLAYQEKYDEALEVIDSAIKKQPQDANLYDSKGEFYLMKGDKKNARKMWKQVITLDPDFPQKHETVLYQKLIKK